MSDSGQAYSFTRCAVDDIADLVRLRCAQMVDIEMHDAGESYLPTTLDDAVARVPGKAQEIIRAYFVKMLPTGECVAWIARDATTGDPAATATYVAYNAPPSLHDFNGRRGQIHNVYTVGDHRRKGLGRQLINHLIADAQAAGLSRLELRSSREAQEFYVSLGFEAAPFFKLRLGGDGDA